MLSLFLAVSVSSLVALSPGQASPPELRSIPELRDVPDGPRWHAQKAPDAQHRGRHICFPVTRRQTIPFVRPVNPAGQDPIGQQVFVMNPDGTTGVPTQLTSVASDTGRYLSASWGLLRVNAP